MYFVLAPVVGFIIGIGSDMLGSAITYGISMQFNLMRGSYTALYALPEGIFGSNTADPGLIYWMKMNIMYLLGNIGDPLDNFLQTLF